MTTYTREAYESHNGTTQITTTEYRMSDGDRWVKIIHRTPKPIGFGYTTSTKVLRADFEGDREHRSTLKELEATIANADIVMYVNAAAEAPKADAVVTIGAIEADRKTEEPEDVDALRIKPGYEEQAHPMSRRQEAVLLAISAELELTAPMDVLPPLTRLGDVAANFGDEGSRVVVEVDAEGFIDKVRVRFIVAGTTEWVSLSPSGSEFFLRLKDAARAGRRVVKPEDNNLLGE